MKQVSNWDRYASMALATGLAPCFLILNELISEHQKFSDYVEKLDIKFDGGSAEKFDDWSVDTP